jgi:hypothetical protein
MKKYITVTQTIEVQVDETKFNQEFMEEFQAIFYPFKTIDEHLKHLAQLYARGLNDNGDFIEGYGYADDMGIKFRNTDFECEVEE